MSKKLLTFEIRSAGFEKGSYIFRSQIRRFTKVKQSLRAEKANKIKGYSMYTLIFKNFIACALFARAFLFRLSSFALEQLFRQTEAPCKSRELLCNNPSVFGKDNTKGGVMKKSSLTDIIFLCVATVFIVTLGVAFFLLPKENFSERENRYLTDTPSLSLSNLFEGEYLGELTSYYSDHFPLRNEFMSLYYLCERAQLRTEVGGILIGEHGGNTVLSARPDNTVSEKAVQNLSVLRQICENSSDVIFYMPPTVFDEYSDAFPSLLHSPPYELLSDKCAEFIREFLSQEADLFYRTDHHWTSDGAFFAYRQLCSALGICARDELEFERQTVSRDFFGTAFSGSAMPTYLATPDELVLLRHSEEADIEITNRETGKIISLYEFSALHTADKYRVFLGGNYSHLSLRHRSGERPRLLLIKDSFANSLIPLLALHYDLEIADPRYISHSELEKIMSQEYDKTLFLLSLDTLSQVKIANKEAD